MAGGYDIECTAKGKAGLFAPIILLVIGVPHLLLGIIAAINFNYDAFGLFMGLIFCFSGTVCLSIAAALYLNWRNKKARASADGLSYTDAFGRTSFHPWDKLTITDDESRFALKFEDGPKRFTITRSLQGYTDLRNYLIDRGLLHKKSGEQLEPEKAETVTIISEEKLF